MVKFFYSDNRLQYANEHTKGEVLDEKQLFNAFAENLRELRKYCNLSLMELAELTDIPNQTLSSYENKSHVPSLTQAVKIAAFFGLTVEDFILCGWDNYPYDITELYEKNKK